MPLFFTLPLSLSLVHNFFCSFDGKTVKRIVKATRWKTLSVQKNNRIIQFMLDGMQTFEFSARPTMNCKKWIGEKMILRLLSNDISHLNTMPIWFVYVFASAYSVVSSSLDSDWCFFFDSRSNNSERSVLPAMSL